MKRMALFLILSILPWQITLAKADDTQPLDLKYQYNQDLSEIEAQNTDLIVETFLQYFWNKPVSVAKSNMQLSIVSSDENTIIPLKEGERVYDQDCASNSKSPKTLVFYNSGATRTLNGRNADNFQIGYTKFSATENGGCKLDTPRSLFQLVSASDVRIPSHNARAIHYALKQKGVDFGHCGLRHSVDLMASRHKLNIVDCYTEDHGFDKKQSSKMENIYPTISIATYGRNFLGISINDTTYTEVDIGKTRQQIYAQNRSNTETSKAYRSYLSRYLSHTKASNPKAYTAYFQHLDNLDAMPRFVPFPQKNFDNFDILDMGLSADEFTPDHQIPAARLKRLRADLEIARDEYKDKKDYKRLIATYEPYSTEFGRPLLELGPSQARILHLNYLKGYADRNAAKRAKRRKNTLAKRNHYFAYAIELGSPDALAQNFSNFESKFEKTKKVTDIQSFAYYLDEYVRTNYPDDLSNMDIFKVERLSRKALEFQVDAFAGKEEKPQNKAASHAIPNPISKCEFVSGLLMLRSSSAFQRGSLYEQNLSDTVGFLSLCMEAATDSTQLETVFNAYYPKYHDPWFVAVSPKPEEENLLPLFERKYASFDQHEKAREVKVLQDKTLKEVELHGAKWRNTNDAANNQREAVRREDYRRKKAKERRQADAEASYQRRFKEKWARIEAQDRRSRSQSTGQMLSDALSRMGGDPNNDPIERMEQETHANLEEINRRNAEIRRLERERKAAEQAKDYAAAQHLVAQQQANRQRTVEQKAAQQGRASTSENKPRPFSQPYNHNPGSNDPFTDVPAAIVQESPPQNTAGNNTLRNNNTAATVSSGNTSLTFQKREGWATGDKTLRQCTDGICVILSARPACFGNDATCEKVNMSAVFESKNSSDWCASITLSSHQHSEPPRLIRVKAGASKTMPDSYFLKSEAPITMKMSKVTCTKGM